MALARASLLVRATARVAAPMLARGFAAVQPDAGKDRDINDGFFFINLLKSFSRGKSLGTT